MCHSALYRTSCIAGNATATLSIHLRHQDRITQLSSTLLTSQYGFMVLSSVCDLANVIPSPHYGPPTRKDCCRSSHVLHLASQVLFQYLDRQNRFESPKVSPRTGFHDDTVLLCDNDHGACAALVLEPMGKRGFPLISLHMECV